MKNKDELKKWMFLILFAIVSYWLVNNIGIIFNAFSKIISVMSPFILGISLAYILNIPMMKIENFLKSKIKDKLPFRIISIILSLMLLFVIILFVAFMLIPELIENIELLIQNIPILIEKIESFVLGLLDKYPDMQEEIATSFKENASINELLVKTLNYILNGSINLISSLVSGIVTIFTALIFAIYMLSQKENLISTLKKLINTYLKKDYAKKIMEIGTLSNNVFSKFISGQCVEAVILGCIFFVVLTIFRFPYALIISVLTTITALIPIFGAFIAMAVGTVLIAITNPIQALIFILVFLVIQQIEGNFIYPKVVGKSVGLSPMLTLLSTIVFGDLFGIIGMLVGLPVTSIVYFIIKNDIVKKLEKSK